MPKKIAIGADHGGFDLKEEIIKTLKRSRYRVDDMGTDSAESCDYPLFAFDVAKKVSDKKADRGILICKSGIGMAIAANKFPGVRAGLCHSVKDAISARKHNNTNVLVLAANRISKKKAVEIAKVWLKTNSLKGRHARRIRQITDMEKTLYK